MGTITNKLIPGLKVGDADAFADLFRRYWPRLVSLADKRGHRKFDAEGIAQEAEFSFWRGLARDGFPLLQNSGDLWRILAYITVRKVIDHFEADARKKRKPPGERVDFDGIKTVAGSSPRPDQVAILNDLLACLRRDLHPDLQDVLELLLKGHSQADISRTLRIPDTLVEARVRRIRKLLKRLLEGNKDTGSSA